MALPIDLDGPRAAPASGGPALQLVVLLHGLGADGEDLIALAPILAEVLPEAAFVAPHAPFPCDMAPMGRQWFSLQRQDPHALLAGAEGARGVLDRFLDAELARLGLDDAALALVGFSQGTMTALHTALRRPRACAGVVGYSGLLVGAAELARDITVRPPVLLVHGAEDEVVPADFLPAAAKALEACRVPLRTQLRPGLGHGIDEVGVALARDFLVEIFAASGPGR